MFANDDNEKIIKTYSSLLQDGKKMSSNIN